MKNTWIEVKKFFKNNILILLAGTIGIAAWFTYTTFEENKESVNVIEETKTEETAQLDAYPATFKFYVKRKDGDPFSNSALIEEYLLRPEILADLSNKTNIELLDYINESGNKIAAHYSATGEAKNIGITRNSDTNVHELQVNIGNESNNLQIAEEINAMLLANEIPFLEEEKIISFQEPALTEVKAVAKAPQEMSDELPTETSIVRSILLGTLFGAVVTTAILLIFSFLSKNLKYSFSYSTNEKDYFFLADKVLDNKEELAQILKASEVVNQVVLIEDINSKTWKNFIKNYPVKQTHNLIETENLKQVERLVYIILENETTRNWYNTQREMERSYNLPVFVVQMNQNFLSE